MAVTKTTINKPKIILPTNYSLTLSEGEVVKITGTSENLHDYKIIYAKRRCDVANAVANYNSASGYYAATATELKNKLISSSSSDVSYYVLKDFDAGSTFISQDSNDKKSFYIRTPNTNDLQNINNFYVLQWFKNVEPGDLVYLYAIERGTVKTTEPGESVTKKLSSGNWVCRCCNSPYYDFWNWTSNGANLFSPYVMISLTDINTFLKQYASCNLSATFTLGVSKTCGAAPSTIDYPPEVYLANRKLLMRQTTVDSTLLSCTISNNRYVYNVPINLLKNLITEGYSHVFFNTEWGKNRIGRVYFVEQGTLTLTATKPSVSTSEIGYSDGKYNNINQIPLSDMTPYVVIPPAVRPVELTLKDISNKEAIISYSNPLYGQQTDTQLEYTSVGTVSINAQTGNDKNDLSNLNAKIDSTGKEVQTDSTLNLGSGEKRLTTYEKKVTIPSSAINAIKSSKSNNFYMDLEVKSADDNKIKFENITNKNIKLQVMFSKSGNNKTRIFDLDSSIIDSKQAQYNFLKTILNKNQFVNNGYDTVHLLYNVNRYDTGKAFDTEDWKMQLAGGGLVSSLGWTMIGSNPGTCTFTSHTTKIIEQTRQYDKYKIRLCLENLKSTKTLFAPPKIQVTCPYIDNQGNKVNKTTVLSATTSGSVAIGSDIYYDIPNSLYDILLIDEKLTFSIQPQTPYPVDLPNIEFSNAYIEVISINDVNEVINKYAAGFNANIKFYTEKTNVSNSSNTVSVFDPVQCIDVIMCCFDSKKNLINKSSSKRRDIYNGKELIYYTDRQWHNFVNEKYKNHVKYKPSYDMLFDVPSNTEYLFFIAFSYSNWHDNPSIYSMSNILSSKSVSQDFSLTFTKPAPTRNESTGAYYASSGANNPVIGIKVTSEKSGNITVTDNVLDNGFNLATDTFNRSKWVANPIIYSNTKKYGYELPAFNSASLYIQNNVVSSIEPLYNDIEFYNKWSRMYGKEIVPAPNTIEEANRDNDLIDIESSYTIYEDEGDKFISNNAVPYIELPAEIASYDRSKITLFLDAHFGLKPVADSTTPSKPVENEKYKLVTEYYEENYNITSFNGKWGIQTLWTYKMMNNLMDIAAIEDIKIEFGMQLNNTSSVPAAGVKAPTLVEHLYVSSSTSYNYDPATKFPAECSGDNIREYAGNNVLYKKGEGYKYFEIRNARIKRQFLECNCHRRRHDAIIFENFNNSYWNRLVKVKFTVTRKVNKDGTPLYKKQNLPAAHYSESTWVPGWAMYSMPKFKTDNAKFIATPTASNPKFELTYDVLFSPIVFYYKNNPTRGDEYGNIYKYTWGDNANAYMKWETITLTGTAPCTISKTHYYIAYESQNVVYKTFKITVGTDGTIKIQ